MKNISKRKKILVHELQIKKSRCDIKSVSYQDYLNAAIEDGMLKCFF